MFVVVFFVCFGVYALHAARVIFSFRLFSRYVTCSLAGGRWRGEQKKE